MSSISLLPSQGQVLSLTANYGMAAVNRATTIHAAGNEPSLADSKNEKGEEERQLSRSPMALQTYSYH